MNASVLPDGITVYVYARTDVGMKRQGNEDSFLIADLSSGRLGLGPEVTAHQLGSQGSLMVVSDGLGGAAAGEVASAMAVQTVCTELMKSTKSVLPPNDRLKRATELANDQIWSCAQSDNSLRGMGATLTAAFIYGTSVYIAQVGDSRAYIIRGGRVKQVTEDQSWANAVKKAGLEIADVPSNVILQALGTQPKVHVEVTSVELLNGDVLLMCSDGLSNKIKDLEMREIASGSEDLADSCQELVDLANKRGGEDNITVILARFEGKSLSKGFEEKDLSITSTFKVVTPLDFGESDENDTISFRADEPAIDPMSVTQSALFDGIPTISGIPPIPPTSNKPSKETKPHSEVSLPATAPLTSESTGKEEKVPVTTPLVPANSAANKKNLSSTERTAFRQAETKTDLPAITPVFDVSKELTPEPKSESGADIKIEFVPTPVKDPRISSSPVLPKTSKPDVVALPPKPNFPISTNPSSEKNAATPQGELPKLSESKPLAPPALPPPPIAASLSMAKDIKIQEKDGVVSLPTKPSVPNLGAAKLPPPPVVPQKPLVAPPTLSPLPPLASQAGLSPAPTLPPVKPSMPMQSNIPAAPAHVGLPPMPATPITKPSAPVMPPAPLPPAGLPPAPVGLPPSPQKPITKPSAPVMPALFSPPSSNLSPEPFAKDGKLEPPKPIMPPSLGLPATEKPTLPSLQPLGQQSTSPILPPPSLTETNSPVAPPLPSNLFAPPPKPAAPNVPNQEVQPKKISPPPSVLPSAPLNLFGSNNTSPLDTTLKPSSGLFSAPPPSKASSPNAPKVDDFLENSLFSPAPPKSGFGTLPPPPAPRPSEPNLENSLFSPPSAPKPEPKGDFLGLSSPGLIFPEAFKERNSPPPPKKLDDEANPIMLETLSVATPEEPKTPPSPLFAPPNAQAPSAPLFPPPQGRGETKPIAAPLFAPPTANKPPVQPSFVPPSVGAPSIPPPLAKPEAGQNDTKPINKTGVEVLASLFSAPSGKANPPVAEIKPPVISPAMLPPPIGVQGAIPPPVKTDSGVKEPIKPAPPALVLPPSPKKADIPSLVAPPLKPTVPPLSPPSKPEISLPPPPLGMSMPSGEDKAKNLKDSIAPLGASIPPPPRQEGDAKKPLFSPPPSPAPSKPVNLPPPPTPAGAKIDLPPSPSVGPTPLAKAPSPLLPPPVSNKPSSFDDVEPPPIPKSAGAAFSEVETTPKPKNQLNPKLLLALGAVVVAIVTIVIVIFTFSGKDDPTPTASNSPTPQVTPTVEPVETPVASPSPVATKAAKETPTPVPTNVSTPEPVIPADTPSLIKYALAQVTLVLDRAQKEMPDTDPTKASRLRSLGAYKEELTKYVSKNVADDGARNFAESALSQIKGLKAQLDALPKSSSGKGKKGK
ncbi:MAG: protein phosphatase 2C domain-containing protein [Acidobacteria bacterium]|nr:protein phosphatase 2C domain-containing protein [Acidobacteriota bacterium]